MGTEVQSKMYLPGYYSIQNLSSNVNHGGWSLLHESKTLKNGQQYDMFPARPVMDGFHGGNKEQLRHIILKHESIFKHQLNELHRLYERQKDLMNEIKSKELLIHPKATGTSQSTLFSSGFQTDDRKSWHISNFPLVDSDYYGRPSALSTGISQCNSIGKIMQTCGGPSQSGVRLKDREPSDSRGKKRPRRLFNLELPADQYISDEEEPEGVVMGSGTKDCPPNKRHEVTQARDKILFNHIGETSGYNSSALSSGLCLERSNGLTNLNEPIHIDKVSATTSVFNFGNDTSSKEEIERQALSANAYQGVWPFAKKFPENPQMGKDGRVTNLHLKSETNQKGWLTNTLKSEQTRSFSGGSFGLQDSKKSCESSVTEARKAYEPAKIFPSDQNKTEKWINSTIFGIQISKRDTDSSAKSSQSDVAISESSPNWTKPPSRLSQNLISVQGNTFFNTSAQPNRASIMLQQSPELIRDRFLVDCNSIPSTPGSEAEVSHQNGVSFRAKLEANESQACHPSITLGFQNGDSNQNSASEIFAQHGHRVHHSSIGHWVDAKSAIDVNDVVPLNKYLHGVTGEQNTFSLHGLRNPENPQGRLHWLEAMPLCNGKSSKESEASHQMKINSLWSYSKKFVNRTDLRKGPSQSPIQDSSSLIRGHDTENGKPDCLASVVDSGNSIKIGLAKSDMVHDPVSHMCREQLKAEGLMTMLIQGLANDNADSRHQIDLNRCITEEETQMTPSSPIMKTKTVIDLEAPVIDETDVAGEDSMESICKEPFDSPHEGLISVVAEALVAISSSQAHDMQDNATHDLGESATCQERDASVSDCLLWFAETISSHEENFENENEAKVKATTACDEESFPDVMDYFEYMTLNLVETKVKQYSYMPPDSDKPKEEVELTKRPRRGQTRRGRQRKDFQRDILPGLASLSRNEVTEDLQIIEGLIRTAGGSWQSGVTHRNASKSGRGRGRKRLANCAPSTIVTAAVSPPQIQQPKCGELQGPEETSLTGWGKRTRRPPRQRCPTNNSLVPDLK